MRSVGAFERLLRRGFALEKAELAGKQTSKKSQDYYYSAMEKFEANGFLASGNLDVRGNLLVTILKDGKVTKNFLVKKGSKHGSSVDRRG